jgi:DNA-binding MarR family transcriptional regulator
MAPMPRPARADDATAILDDLRRIVRVLRESSRSVERHLGVSGAQLFALKVLSQGPALSLNALAQRTRTHQSTVSVVIKRLCAAGLVSRFTSKDDARRLELAVTAKGRAVLRRAPLAAQERLIEGVEQLTLRERRVLSASLRRLVAAMQLEEHAPAMFFEEEDSARANGKRRAPSRSARSV